MQEHYGFFIMMKTPALVKGGTNLTNSVLVLFFIFYVLRCFPHSEDLAGYGETAR